MKHLLITTIAAVLVVGCGDSQQSAPTSAEVKPAEPVAKVPSQPSQPSPPPAESKPAEPVAEASQPEPTAAEAPDISIHKAARVGHIEAVKQHLAAGADVNAKDDDGYTPLDYAVPAGKEETADLLRKHGGISGAEDSIHVAAIMGNIEAVRQHLAAGADVNAKNQNGSTPLHLAPASGHKEIAELLIARGADVNAKNKYGVTPLHFAAGYGRKETVELLIAKGADVSAKVVSGPKQGLTPLDAANETSQTETADLLRKHGGKTGEELKAEGK